MKPLKSFTGIAYRSKDGGVRTEAGYFEGMLPKKNAYYKVTIIVHEEVERAEGYEQLNFGKPYVRTTCSFNEVKSHLDGGGKVYRISKEEGVPPLEVVKLHNKQLQYVDGSVDIFGYPHISHFELERLD